MRRQGLNPDPTAYEPTGVRPKNCEFFYLDLGLDILDGVRGLHLQGDGLARQGLHKDLHGRLNSGVKPCL
jgi:hypothetical protein